MYSIGLDVSKASLSVHTPLNSKVTINYLNN